MKSQQLILALALAAAVLGDQPTAAASDPKTKSELEGLTTAWVIVEFNKDISVDCREMIRMDTEKRMQNTGLKSDLTSSVASLTFELVTTPVLLTDGKEAGVAALIRLSVREPAKRLRPFHKNVTADTWLIRSSLVAPRGQLDQVVYQEAMKLLNQSLVKPHAAA
jgi:hypothetical protein